MRRHPERDITTEQIQRHTENKSEFSGTGKDIAESYQRTEIIGRDKHGHARKPEEILYRQYSDQGSPYRFGGEQERDPGIPEHPEAGHRQISLERYRNQEYRFHERRADHQSGDVPEIPEQREIHPGRNIVYHQVSFASQKRARGFESEQSI